MKSVKNNGVKINLAAKDEKVKTLAKACLDQKWLEIEHLYNSGIDPRDIFIGGTCAFCKSSINYDDWPDCEICKIPHKFCETSYGDGDGLYGMIAFCKIHELDATFGAFLEDFMTGMRKLAGVDPNYGK